MPNDDGLRVGLHYQGHQLSVPAGLFMHLLNCASNRASDVQIKLEMEPLNWDSPMIDTEFANRKQSILHCQETVELARRIKEYLQEHASCP